MLLIKRSASFWARFKATREARTARIENEKFQAGYDFAVDALLTGTESAASLEAMSMGFDGDRDRFDQGIDVAIDDLIAGGKVEDNR